MHLKPADRSCTRPAGGEPQYCYGNGQCCPSDQQCVLNLDTDPINNTACCALDVSAFCGGSCCDGFCVGSFPSDYSCCESLLGSSDGRLKGRIICCNVRTKLVAGSALA